MAVRMPAKQALRPPSTTKAGKMSPRLLNIPVTLLGPAARTSSGYSNAAAVAASRRVQLLAAVTDISGTGAYLGLQFQWSNDQAAWYAGDSIVRTYAAGTLLRLLETMAQYLRISYTIAGTDPSVTFGISVNLME